MEPVCLVTFMAKGFILGQLICLQQDCPLGAATELQALQRAGGQGRAGASPCPVAAFQQWLLPWVLSFPCHPTIPSP